VVDDVLDALGKREWITHAGSTDAFRGMEGDVHAL